jgi:hypothetical protein
MKENRIFFVNAIGTILQFIGTLWLWIDSLHVSARLPSEGMTLGDPIEYRTWYYHWASPIGFGLLMIGFDFCGVALWLSRPRSGRATKHSRE